MAKGKETGQKPVKPTGSSREVFNEDGTKPNVFKPVPVMKGGDTTEVKTDIANIKNK